MTVADLPNRPAFQNVETAEEIPETPSTSILAILAFLFGLIGIFSIFSLKLLPFCVVAAGLGIVSLWRISRDDSLGGFFWGQAGLALGVATAIWGVVGSGGHDRYMYYQAASNAKIFLELLSEGKKFEALELRQEERARQITGTNLEEYYTSLSGEDADRHLSFLNAKHVKAIIAAGDEAQWEFLQGVEIKRNRDSLYITVDMQNVSRDPPQRARVKMHRQLNVLNDPEKQDTTALWNVQDVLDVAMK